MAKEQHSPCVLPDKFLAGGIIAKLPQSWREFSTTPNTQATRVADLNGSLDVEEKARTKTLTGEELSLCMVRNKHLSNGMTSLTKL